MAGVIKTRKGHDDIYEAVEAGGVDGGNLVIPSATPSTNAGVQGVEKAGDAATDVLGVAGRRAVILAEQNLTSTDADGYPVAYANPVNELTVVYKAAVVPVVYTAAVAAYGQKLVAAANGEVRAYNDVTPDPPDSIVGECRVVGGMGAAGGKGLAYIY